jgi:hypothetical protein
MSFTSAKVAKNVSMRFKDENAAKGVNIGLMLIILAAVVAVIITIFTIGRNTANEGVSNLQGSLGDMQTSIYNDYDQKNISGSQVTAAYNAFQGKPIAIIVKTCKGSWTNYNALVTPFDATTVDKTGAPFEGLSYDASSKQYSSTVSYFDKTTANVEIALQLSTGGGDTDKQIVLYNNVTTAMYKNGNSKYVNPTSKYSSYIIRDAGDSIIGIVFIQSGKHTVQ